MKKYTAKKVPFSSIVGQSVTLREGEGPVAAQLMILVPNPQFEYKPIADEVSDRIVAYFNGGSDKVAHFVDDKFGGYWQTTVDGHPYNFRHHKESADYIKHLEASTARWVNAIERAPAVGGTYYTGRWVGPKNGLRQFRQRRLFFIIHEGNRPTWYDYAKDIHGNQKLAFPDFWLEGVPSAPADENA